MQNVAEGRRTFSTIYVNDTTHAGMCVSDLNVSLDIDHPCTGQLTIVLYGPGTPSLSSDNNEDTLRGKPADLFGGYNGTDGGEVAKAGDGCGAGIGPGFKLSDHAQEGVWECCGKGR